MKKVYIFSAPKDYQIRQFASYFPVLSNFVSQALSSLACDMRWKSKK